MKNSEALDRAADVLAREGWTKGTKGVIPGHGPKCVDGALSLALYGSLVEVYSVELQPAGIALKQFLGRGTRSLCGWNDHQAVNGEEVIEALRDCAEKERLHGR